MSAPQINHRNSGDQEDQSGQAEQPQSVRIDGQPLDLNTLAAISSGEVHLELACDKATDERLEAACDLVDQAVEHEWQVYGVTTGFGSMADVPVSSDHAIASQNNLLSFLSTGAGDEVDPAHVRAAMALRANVLMRGHSGIRKELIERLVQFLNADAVPVVQELGSIGASGDLVPLTSIAKAITGQGGASQVRVSGDVFNGSEALEQLSLSPISLRPKEGLALVNGTSFSSAIAASCVSESKSTLAISLVTNAIMMRALQVQPQPFDDFVHRLKPHRGQQWAASAMRELLRDDGETNASHASANGHEKPTPDSPPNMVQDRYSLRCYPQFIGPVVEGIARIEQTVVTEMNAVSDNPLVDVDAGRFVQSGNFLGQYLATAMDELRGHLAMIARHLDVQTASLVTPEFSGGLPPSLRGNDGLPYNMGLKGLQITGNSIMPLLCWYANPLTSHFPTHAEQFNQNVNGLSFSSATLAWKSVTLLRHYLATSMLMAVQAIDFRCKMLLGHFDGRALLSPTASQFYEAVFSVIEVRPDLDRPLIFDDADQSVDVWQSRLFEQAGIGGRVSRSADEALDPFE